MGMDVYGRKPKNGDGEYFRNNVWWWRPLADYCCEIVPEFAGKCYWHSNDGTGLFNKDAVTLADKLQAEIDSGRCASFAAIREAELAALPNEPCNICDGTGKRKELPLTGAGDFECNGCNGTGSREPWAKSYPFSVENVQSFANFARNSGGFKIC